MNVATVTAPSGGLLEAVRSTLGDADEALVCVAFAQSRGVHLVASELETVSKRDGARVIVTTTLGTSTPEALAAISKCGAALRVLNPAGGTYHPKVFLGRKKRTITAVIGSANLTSGLRANVEAATVLSGTTNDRALDDVWRWAESVWSDPRGRVWTPPATVSVEEAIEPELLAQLLEVARTNPILYTLGPSPRRNYVRDVTPSGVWVETDASREKGTGPQPVEPRMLNLAWDVLRSTGRLTSQELQGANGLRVHRSSFVLAALRRLPGVEQESSRPLVLTYVSQ